MSDGTPAGTSMVGEILPGFNGPHLEQLTDVEGRLYFVAFDPVHREELWTSDGNATELVTDFPNGPNQYGPDALTAVGDTLYFMANDTVHGYELWRTSEGGPILVKDIWPGKGWSQIWPSRRAHLGNVIFFRAGDRGDGQELWRSDGTDDGTSIVADIRQGSASSRPSWLVAVTG
jgi:ELWxxDGT repeat protein